MEVLVTGANRGIGAALRAAFQARGDTVWATRRDAGDAAGWFHLDVADPASVAALAASLAGRPLDLLVCNAGVYLDRDDWLAEGYPAAAWAETFAVNVTGVFLTIQALLPNLRAARGRIAIIGSRMGSDARAPGGSYIYRASKAAVLNLGRNLAADLRPDGIALGVYHPGWVTTEIGGPGAQIAPDASARDLLRRFDALSLTTSGCFESHDGTPIPF
ncbi:SDR family NAD(P)-dependent oxidoreductase [Albidovulum sediminicola]|uniref:SDR family NAD(P)-dependent oxidoreductase n=1 Tax=Albidovulum sediminicola TaxID=2984331 RepID=A0ABT2Z453_9RHOB|nr:SDR family NAD(P)-dependent oxidoreductase [Defluviimonas sp. WL0075]MCV2865561.1 SDR family NAD(P)-dependent oxidoreductase [Defluviimonas sp. WL0075]